MLDDVREMTAKALELTGVQQLSAFESGMIAGLRRELVQAKETAAVALRVAATKQQTIDEQRVLIEELAAERDALVAANEQRERNTNEIMDALEQMKKLPQSRAVHHDEWPAFPASALRGGDGILR